MVNGSGSFIFPESYQQKMAPVGRPANVPRQEAIKLIEKHIERFTTNDFPPISDPLWMEMSQEVDGRWKPQSAYTHVRTDKRGDLTQARRNQKISVPPICKSLLIDAGVDSDYDEDFDLDTDDDYMPDDLPTKEEQSKLPKYDIRLTNEEWSLIKPDSSKNETRLKKDAWTSVIFKVFNKKYAFQCVFAGKWSHVRSNFIPGDEEYFLKFVAYCKDRKDCKNMMIGEANHEPNNRGLMLTMRARDTRREHHKVVHPQVKGDERVKMGKKLQKQSAANFREELLRNDMLFGEDVPPHIQELHVYRQIRMEIKKQTLGLQRNEKIDVMKFFSQMCSDPKFSGTIRAIGCVPFYVFYWSPEQVKVYNEYVRLLGKLSVISIDATGTVIKPFENCPGKMTGHIFLYTVTIRMEGVTVCVCQMVTEVHTEVFIESWMRNWTGTGAKSPGEVWTDYQRALPSAACFTFNQKTLKDYVDTLFIWAKEGKQTKLPVKTLIRIDVPHIMALVSRWKCFRDNTPPKVKKFFIRCFSLMVDAKSVDEFELIFLLTCIVALQQNLNDAISIPTFQGTVLEARERLEKKIANRREIIKQQEQSMEDIQKKNQESKPFEEGGSGTLTHRWIKDLIKSVTPSDVLDDSEEDAPLNPFCLPDLGANLERLGKEFPLWTSAALPPEASERHAATSYQEGYFAYLRKHIFENVKLPTSGLQFVLSHCAHLTSSSNLLSAKLTGFSHDVGPVSESVGESESMEDYEPPLKKQYTIDDSDLKSSENWRGLGDRREFPVGMEDSDDEIIKTGDANAESGNHKTEEKDLANDQNKKRKIRKNTSVDNSFINGFLNDQLIREQVSTNANGISDIELNDQRAEAINSDVLQTPEPKSHSSPNAQSIHTVSPHADHSYASLSIPNMHKASTDIDNSEEHRNTIPNEKSEKKNCTTAGLFSEKNSTVVNEEKSDRTRDDSHGEINNNDEPIQSHPENKIHVSKQISRNAMREERNKKKEQEIRNVKAKGFYYQDNAETAVLNAREMPQKRGFLLINGRNCTVITIKKNYAWNFHPDAETARLQNGIKVDVTNTCGFDALVHIIQFSALDSGTFKSFMENSDNDTLQFISQFIRGGLTKEILLQRLKILNKSYPIKKMLNLYALNAKDAIISIWKNSFTNEPSGFREYHCNNPECVERATQSIPFFCVNEKIIRQHGYGSLRSALLYHPKISNIKCREPGCKGTATEETVLNLHICIELDVRATVRDTDAIDCSLNDLPVSLELKQRYRLAGVVHYSSEHFVAYCLRSGGNWLCCDDLAGKIQLVRNPKKTIVKPHAVIYILE